MARIYIGKLDNKDFVLTAVVVAANAKDANDRARRFNDDHWKPVKFRCIKKLYGAELTNYVSCITVLEKR